MKNCIQWTIAFLLLTLIACTKEKKGSPPVVTKLICYDVQLKNPDTLSDNWHQFLNDSARTAFLEDIIKPVLAGQVQAWIWEDKLRVAKTEELKPRFFQDPAVPLADTLDPVNYRVDLSRITRIRYWEEWSMHRKSLLIDKKVMGISLIQDIYDEEGTFRGTEPLFYIFYDESLPVRLSE